MFIKRNFALYAPEGDADGGAGGGGSSDHDDSGGDKDVVPKKQFVAALNEAERKREREIAALRTEFEGKLAAATAKPAETAKRYTKAELKAAVAADQITQDQADAQWEKQIREETLAEARQETHATVTAVERSKEIDAQISRYKAAAPEILDDSHETRQSIRTEFQALVALGDDPKDVATQLKAIRAVLGPVEKLEKARSGTNVHDTHHETGGGGDGGTGKKKTGKLVDKLNAETRKYYEKRIEQGVNKDWADVESELKYASPAVRQRYGIA